MYLSIYWKENFYPLQSYAFIVTFVRALDVECSTLITNKCNENQVHKKYTRCQNGSAQI